MPARRCPDPELQRRSHVRVRAGDLTLRIGTAGHRARAVQSSSYPERHRGEVASRPNRMTRGGGDASAGRSCGRCEAVSMARQRLLRYDGWDRKRRRDAELGGCRSRTVAIPTPSASRSAAFPIDLLTALHMLVTRAQVRAGRTCSSLVPGGSEAAIQSLFTAPRDCERAPTTSCHRREIGGVRRHKSHTHVCGGIKIESRWCRVG